MTITTTAPTVDENGISVPQFSDILEYLKAKYRAIYGDDVYLEADGQDGQFLAIIAASINDSNAAAVAVYNSFSPATAKGNGLSSNIKINGITRNSATNSTAIVTITGVVGTTITGGLVSDGSYTWALPYTVTIPVSGYIDVTATCQTSGAIAAEELAINTISTPVLGWQSVSNANAATVGADVESDAAVRVKQAQSVAIPSLTALEGTIGAVESLSGVVRVKGYENDTSSTDSNGIPANSIALVVDGGDSATIAAAIAAKKTPGAATYGSTTVQITDAYGIVHPIKYSAVTAVPISVELSITALDGYTTAIADAIKAALVAFIAALDIGEDVIIPRLYVPAMLSGAADADKYKVTALAAAIKPNAPGTSDLVIAYSQAATLASADITITVT